MEHRPTIPYKVRDQHIYIPGKTRHGKTTLMHRMVIQDIANGAGVTVIDPKSDLITLILDSIPPHRVNDTIALSLARPVPIDFLDYATDDDNEKESLVSELKYLITKGATTEHAPLMTAILTDIIYTILLYNERQHDLKRRATFLDIHYFLSDEARREEILSLLKDTRFYRRWKDDFPNPKDRQPTLTRMNPFINSRSLQKIFGCPNPRLNIATIMDERKILLVDLGGLSDVTRMLGTLIITKIQQAIFRRHGIRNPRDRVPHFLYVDEFQECQTSTFNQLLSMAGGYGLRLCLANQFVGQLDQIVRESIFGNVSTFIVFCIGETDTRYFKTLALPCEHERLAQLPRHTALFKIAGRSQAEIRATLPTLPLLRMSPAQAIQMRTIKQYACPSGQDLPPDLKSKQDEPVRKSSAFPHER